MVYSQIISLVWILTVVTVEINRNTILDVLIVTSIFLLIIFLTFYENVKNERLSTEKGFLVIQTIGLSKTKMRKYDLQEIDILKVFPRIMWINIWAENPHC